MLGWHRLRRAHQTEPSLATEPYKTEVVEPTPDLVALRLGLFDGNSPDDQRRIIALEHLGFGPTVMAVGTATKTS